MGMPNRMDRFSVRSIRDHGQRSLVRKKGRRLSRGWPWDAPGDVPLLEGADPGMEPGGPRGCDRLRRVGETLQGGRLVAIDAEDARDQADDGENEKDLPGDGAELETTA